MTVLDCKGHLLSGSELSVDGALDLLSLDAALACDDMPTVDIARHIRAMEAARTHGSDLQPGRDPCHSNDLAVGDARLELTTSAV